MNEKKAKSYRRQGALIFMLVVALLISFMPDTMTMAVTLKSDPGSGTADPNKT